MTAARWITGYATVGSVRNAWADDGIREVGVVVPARNEEDRLGRCLDSIRVAIAQLHRQSSSAIGVRVVVVLDRCSDSSADIVTRYPNVETITTETGNVGTARALGTASLLTDTSKPQTVWLANTDADSIVPADWLIRMLHEARRGADLVLGTVEPDESAGRLLRQAWQALHDAGDGHPHVHGANLGIRASTYLELGGWNAYPTGEDVALVRAAETSRTVRIARIGAIPVITSTRFTGRAPHGFADYLQVLNGELGRAAVSLAT